MTGRITVWRDPATGRFVKLAALFRPHVVPPLRDTLLSGVVMPAAGPPIAPPTGIGRTMAAHPSPVGRHRAPAKPWLGVAHILAGVFLLMALGFGAIVWGFG